MPAAANTAHLFQVFGNLAELQQQRSHTNGRSLIAETHEFTHEAADTNLHLAYTATHHPRHTLALLDADIASDLASMECAGSSVIVTCLSPEVATVLLQRHA